MVGLPVTADLCTYRYILKLICNSVPFAFTAGEYSNPQMLYSFLPAPLEFSLSLILSYTSAHAHVCTIWHVCKGQPWDRFLEEEVLGLEGIKSYILNKRQSGKKCSVQIWQKNSNLCASMASKPSSLGKS